MTHDVESATVGNVRVRVVYDDSGATDSPIDSHDDSVRLVEWSRRHGLNDSWGSKRGFSRDIEPPEALAWAKENGFIVYPVFKYEHGNVLYKTSPFSCPWDSGQSGYLFLSRKEWKRKSKRSDSYAAAILESYSDWCNGSIFGYIIEDSNGDELDSVWGFIGDSDYCLSEGKSQAEFYNRQETERKAVAFAESCYAERPDMTPAYEAAA
jgi:hypothetical protein